MLYRHLKLRLGRIKFGEDVYSGKYNIVLISTYIVLIQLYTIVSQLVKSKYKNKKNLQRKKILGH